MNRIRFTLAPNESREFNTEGICEIKIESECSIKFGVSTQSGAFNFNATRVDCKGVELIDYTITNLSGNSAGFIVTTVNISDNSENADKAAEKPAP